MKLQTICRTLIAQLAAKKIKNRFMSSRYATISKPHKNHSAQKNKITKLLSVKIKEFCSSADISNRGKGQ